MNKSERLTKAQDRFCRRMTLNPLPKNSRVQLLSTEFSLNMYKYPTIRTEIRILVLLLCLCSSVLGNEQRHLANHHARSLGGKVVQIKGVSMEPRLMEDDLVIIVPVDWHDLKPGDMVQFWVNDKSSSRNSLPTWVHQVAKKEGDWITTLGVNNPKSDPFRINKSDVIGKVVAVYIGGGNEFETLSEKAMNYFRLNSGQGKLTKN